MWHFSALAQVQPCHFLGVGTTQGHSTLSEDEQGRDMQFSLLACCIHVGTDIGDSGYG